MSQLPTQPYDSCFRGGNLGSKDAALSSPLPAQPVRLYLHWPQQGPGDPCHPSNQRVPGERNDQSENLPGTPRACLHFGEPSLSLDLSQKGPEFYRSVHYHIFMCVCVLCVLPPAWTSSKSEFSPSVTWVLGASSVHQPWQPVTY